MKKLSEIYEEQGIAFKYPIEIRDANGNTTYREWGDGYCWKSEYDANDKETYHEDSKGYKCKSKYDSKGNKTYFEDSEGTIKVYLRTSVEHKHLKKLYISKSYDGKVVEIDGIKYELKIKK